MTHGGEPSAAELMQVLQQLTADVAALQEEVRRQGREHDRASVREGQRVLTALTDWFEPRLDAIEARIYALEGRVDVNALVFHGLTDAKTASASPPLREIYRRIASAAEYATRTGQPQRIDIPDGDRTITARVPPGIDPATILQSICSPAAG